ncbi:MAG: ubiquitin-like domain-containing protein [Anaerolineae bacterium]
MQPDGHFLPDDTQPIRPPSRRLPRWLWFTFTLFACLIISLSAVAIGVLLTLANAIPVTLVMGSTEYPLTTSARTVGALLDEVNVTLNDGDIVSPARETPIVRDMVVRVLPAHTVVLTVDGQSTVVYTSRPLPAAILEQASLSPDDRILIDGTQASLNDIAAWTQPVRHIEVRRALPVTIHEGDAATTIRTTELTVGEALFASGVTLYLADAVTPALNTPISAQLDITVQRAVPVTIIADGLTLETRTHGTTVADALTQLGVILVGLDYSIPDEDSALQPGMSVRIIRVTEEVLTQQESLPYDTVFQADSTLELDQRQVTQAGQTGLRQITTRVRYENGVEISREVEEDAIIWEPVNAVISYGTNIVVRSLDTPDGTIQYWRVLRLYATSYHPAVLGGDDVTATGAHLERGVVGVETSLIPFGTQMYVPGYGTALAADTGPDRSSPYWIDLGYSDADWVSWSRYIDVYFVLPVPADVVYILPEWRPLRGTTP